MSIFINGWICQGTKICYVKAINQTVTFLKQIDYWSRWGIVLFYPTVCQTNFCIMVIMNTVKYSDQVRTTENFKLDNAEMTSVEAVLLKLQSNENVEGCYPPKKNYTCLLELRPKFDVLSILQRQQKNSMSCSEKQPEPQTWLLYSSKKMLMEACMKMSYQSEEPHICPLVQILSVGLCSEEDDLKKSHTKDHRSAFGHGQATGLPVRPSGDIPENDSRIW